jgi:hypothetical protein
LLSTATNTFDLDQWNHVAFDADRALGGQNFIIAARKWPQERFALTLRRMRSLAIGASAAARPVKRRGQVPCEFNRALTAGEIAALAVDRILHPSFNR